jgi:hypothetical protein
MIRDRDVLTPHQISEIEKSGRVRCLKKRHIENYFLDSEILFKVAEKLYLTADNIELNTEKIESAIMEIAKETLNFNLLQNAKEHLGINYFFKIPTVRSVESKDAKTIKGEIIDGIKASLNSLNTELDEKVFSQWLDEEEKRLFELLKTDTWRNEFQGKIIFSKICSNILKAEAVRVRHAYVDIALAEKPTVFGDVIDILKSF